VIDLPPTEMVLSPELVTALSQPEPSPQAIAEACAQLDAVLGGLLPFVPPPVVDVRLSHPGLDRLHGMYLTGTVVFADLSGFTALVSQFATAGRAGSEEVSALLNRLFAALLEEIHQRGGGLIKFGGDTLTVFFDAARLGGGHISLACAAALAMQARMAEFAMVPTSKGPFRLQLRIAVHHGAVFAAEVGDGSHTELVVTGRAINRVVVAHEGTAPGEVIVSEETLQALEGARAQKKMTGLHRLRSLAVEPPHPPAPPAPWRPGPPSITTVKNLLRQIDLLHPYMLHNLPRRFASAKMAGGEFRPVTVLFASFYAFSKLLALLELPASIERDPAIVRQVLNTYYLRMQQVIHHYGGSINKVDMATFGNRLMVLFGAPTAHEDDPARAVRAALELRAALDTINYEITTLLRDWVEQHPEQQALLRVANVALRQRVGIARGNVFAGIVGTPQRHEYTVMGETVNLAARLLASANNNDILLSSLTHRAVRQIVEAQPLPPLPLEGFAQPVPVFRALGRRTISARASDALLYTTPLVGRQLELERLRDLGQQALRSEDAPGRVVTIVGDPGVGKSRLADEALRVLQTAIPETMLVREACQGYEQTVPYAVAARLLRQLLQVPPDEGQRAQAALVQQQVKDLLPTWSRFAPLLGPLLNLPLPDSDITQALAPEQRRDRLHDLVLMICFALAGRQPLALVLDDVQWADASSLALVEQLALGLAGRPLLLLLIYRPASDLAEPWCALSHCTAIPLGELARVDSEALLRALLDGDLPAELRPLAERVHGTPFYLEETVRYLLESGALERDSSGAWVCTRPIDSGTVPAQVEQLIMARLDRLPDDARALLQIASVLGQHFSEELLASVSQQRNFLPQRLGVLLDAAILLPDERGLRDGYRFKHAVIRDVTYGSMLFARRRELHEHVAATIEYLGAAQSAEQRMALAQHYLHAQQWDHAFPLFLEAAQHGQARYANREAQALYELALAITPWHSRREGPPDIESALVLHENLGDVLALTGNYPGAREHYQRLLGLLEEAGDEQYRARRAALLRKIGSTYENQGELDQAMDWLTQADEMIAPADAAMLEHARVLSDIGWVYFRRSDLDLAQKYLEQALGRIGQDEANDERARILNRLGGVAYTRGDVVLAQSYVEQSLAASEQSNNLADQANALNNLGILTESQARIADSIRYGLQAMEINERIGNRRMLSITANNIGWTFYNSEEYDQAYVYFSRAIEQAIEVRDNYNQMRALLNLGRTLTALGQWDSASQTIQQSQLLSSQLHLSGEQMDSHVALAELRLQQGNIESAIHEYWQGQLLIVDKDSEEFGRFQRLEAKIALVQGDTTQAIELLTANEALFTRLQNMPEAERTRKFLAQISAPEPHVV
jgi:class 3 adenylate cyclase/Tfp pilus assembly protein PilF